jgi:hypothetical protein
MTRLKFNVAHQVPGRVRMKVPAAKGNAELLEQIGEAFSAIPGIERITVNPTTGSVVLHYDVEQHDEFHGRFQHHVHAAGGYHPPTTEIDEFAHRIEEEAEFLAQHSQSARAVVDFFKQFDREIRTATDNNVDLKIVLAGGIIGVTLLEVGMAAATPVWVTLTLFALNHVIEMHARHDNGGPATAPVIVKG